jgi:CRP/FNR family transcriptional regulator
MIEHIFNKYSFFRDGSEGLKDSVLTIAKMHQDEHKSRLFRAGEQKRQVYFIGDGAMRVYVTGHSGRNVTLYRVNPGELCPINLRTAMSKEGALASAEGVDDLIAATMGIADFSTLVANDTGFRTFVIESITSRFDDVIRQVAEITTRSVDYRLERYFETHIGKTGGVDVLHVTNADIATEIGATREVVNRKLHVLEKAGIVELGRGRIRILAADKLRRIK